LFDNFKPINNTLIDTRKMDANASAKGADTSTEQAAAPDPATAPAAMEKKGCILAWPKHGPLPTEEQVDAMRKRYTFRPKPVRGCRGCRNKYGRKRSNLTFVLKRDVRRLGSKWEPDEMDILVRVREWTDCGEILVKSVVKGDDVLPPSRIRFPHWFCLVLNKNQRANYRAKWSDCIPEIQYFEEVTISSPKVGEKRKVSETDPRSHVITPNNYQWMLEPNDVVEYSFGTYPEYSGMGVLISTGEGGTLVLSQRDVTTNEWSDNDFCLVPATNEDTDGPDGVTLIDRIWLSVDPKWKKICEEYEPSKKKPAKTVALDDQGRGPYPTDGKDYYWMADEKKWASSVQLPDEVTYQFGYVHFNAKTRVVDTYDVGTCFLGAVLQYFPKHDRVYRLQDDKEATDRLNAHQLNEAKRYLPEGCKLVLIKTKTRKSFESFAIEK